MAPGPRAELSDAQGAQLAPLLPRGKKSGRPPNWTKRDHVDGIRWRTRTGEPWRVVPARYAPSGRATDSPDAGNGRAWTQIHTRLQAIADRRPDRVGRKRRLDHRPRPPARGRSPT
ncbi:transposase [Rhodococcus sp. Q]|uniref:transposase n=1 Tax=Rhodococcus sp. Q TaxID=2502252 RepID=UPI0020160F26|nr:transposase [Rhodococcus sp. Q]